MIWKFEQKNVGQTVDKEFVWPLEKRWDKDCILQLDLSNCVYYWRPNKIWATSTFPVHSSIRLRQSWDLENGFTIYIFFISLSLHTWILVISFFQGSSHYRFFYFSMMQIFVKGIKIQNWIENILQHYGRCTYTSSRIAFCYLLYASYIPSNIAKYYMFY